MIAAAGTPRGFPFGDDLGSWSPNGEWILFNNKKGNVSVVHPEGTDLHMAVG